MCPLMFICARCPGNIEGEEFFLSGFQLASWSNREHSFTHSLTHLFNPRMFIEWVPKPGNSAKQYRTRSLKEKKERGPSILGLESDHSCGQCLKGGRGAVRGRQGVGDQVKGHPKETNTCFLVWMYRETQGIKKAFQTNPGDPRNAS